MAETLLAVRLGLPGFEKRCCVKRILPSKARDPSFRVQFLAETRLLSRLEHPNIVQAFDSGEVDGTYYLVMEYVEGLDLRRLLHYLRARSRVFSVDVAALIGSRVARALHYAHTFSSEGVAQGIVHRDVTPSNIFVDTCGHIKLLDFGIALFKQREKLTATNAARGSVPYMSPEHLDRALGFDARSDLFSLGSVLYHLLTGISPFDSLHTDAATMLNIQGGKYRSVFALAPHVPLPVARLVDHMLCTDKAERVADGQQVADQLAPYVSGVAERDLEQLVREAQAYFNQRDVTGEAQGDPASDHELVAVDVNLNRPLLDFEAHQPPPRTGSSYPSGEALNEDRVLPKVIAQAAPKRGDGGAYRSEPPRSFRWPMLLAAVLAGATFAWLVVGLRAPTGNSSQSSHSAELPTPPASAALTTADIPAPVGPMPAAATTAILAAQTSGASASEPQQEPTAIPEPEEEAGAAEALSSLTALPPPQPKTATLVVTVYDWGHVWVDGRYRGPSPARISGLKPGEHSLWLAREKDAKPEERHRITLDAGITHKHYRLVTLSPNGN